MKIPPPRMGATRSADRRLAHAMVDDLVNIVQQLDRAPTARATWLRLERHARLLAGSAEAVAKELKVSGPADGQLGMDGGLA